MSQHHLLIVEDDPTLGALLDEKFKNLAWQVHRAPSIDEAMLQINTALIMTHCILDLNISRQSSLSLIPKIIKKFPNCKIVILTGYASVQTTIEAIKLGATYLLSKPCQLSDIITAFEHNAATNKIRLDNHAKSGIDHYEWETIQKALQNNQFNISKTAEELGMHRRTLQRKLRKNPN